MSNSALPPEILEKLQVEYIGTFDEKVASAKSALKAKNWEDLYQVFHKLAGSGATYFMPEISVLGRQVETYLKTTQSPDSALIEESVELLVSIFDGRKNKTPLDLTDHPLLSKLN